MKKLYCSLILLLFFSFGIIAQVGDGGKPVSFGLPAQSINAVEAVNLVKPNVQQLLEEDAINDELGRAYRVGTLIQVNLSPMNSGTWTTLSDGSRFGNYKSNQKML